MTIETVIAILRAIISQTRSDMLEADTFGIADNTAAINRLALIALTNYQLGEPRSFITNTLACLDLVDHKERQSVFNTLAMWSATLVQA